MSQQMEDDMDQLAHLTPIEAEATRLVASKGYDPLCITKINVDDSGKLASVGLGTVDDEDGEPMGVFVLNFAL